MEATPKKKKVSILNLFENEIVDLYNLGVTTPNIAKIINVKLPENSKVSESGFYQWIYRYKKSLQQ